MFMQNSAEELSWPIGIQHARHVSGREQNAFLNDADAFPCAPGITIELDLPQKIHTKQSTATPLSFGHIDYSWLVFIVPFLHHIRSASCVIEELSNLNCLDSIGNGYDTPIGKHVGAVNAETPFLLLFCTVLLISVRRGFENLQILITYLLYVAITLGKIGTYEFDTFIRSVFIGLSSSPLVFVIISTFWKDFRSNHGVSGYSASFFAVTFVVFTVRAIYAGTLVTIRTTAPRYHIPLQSFSVLLAALCIILATLTVAARCYVSTNTTQPIVQLSRSPKNTLSPIFIKYSSTQRHTSKIVLSSLSPREHVQSDTSVIETNSKQLVYNQKTIRNKRSQIRSRSRRKRGTVRNIPFDNFLDYNKDNSLTYESDVKQHSTDLEANEISYKTTAAGANFEYHPDDNVEINSAPPLVIRTKTDTIPHGTPLHKHKYTVNFSKNQTEDQTESVPVVSVPGSVSARNKSVNSLRVASTFTLHQNDPSFDPIFDGRPLPGSEKRPMPPAHGHSSNSLSENGVLVLVVAVVVLTVALGLVTCVLSHYRGGTAANPHDAAQTPTTAPMLSVVSAGATAGVGGMDRLRGRGAARDLAASRDRQVRLHAVRRDIAINLPPSISLPDGEEHPFSSRLHLRDPDQESEIYQKCIRPPPNRTVLDSESPPPYRSSSAGLLGSIGGSSSGSSDWSGGSAPLVVRCHSMTSTSKRPEAGPSGQKTDFIQKTVKIFTGKKSQPSPAPTLPPVVIVPSRTRRTAEQNSTGRPKPNV